MKISAQFLTKLLPVFLPIAIVFSLVGFQHAAFGAEKSIQNNNTLRHSYFVAFTNDNQVSCGDIANDPGATVAGTQGSVFRTTEKGVQVQNGTLVFKTASNRLKIL